MDCEAPSWLGEDGDCLRVYVVLGKWARQTQEWLESRTSHDISAKRKREGVVSQIISSSTPISAVNNRECAPITLCKEIFFEANGVEDLENRKIASMNQLFWSDLQ